MVEDRRRCGSTSAASLQSSGPKPAFQPFRLPLARAAASSSRSASSAVASAFSRSSRASFSASRAWSWPRLDLASIASSRCAASAARRSLASRSFSACSFLARARWAACARRCSAACSRVRRCSSATSARASAPRRMASARSRSRSAGDGSPLRSPIAPAATSSGSLAILKDVPTTARGMLRRPMSTLLWVDRVGARLGEARLALEGGRVLQLLGLVGGGALLVGARGALLQLALGLRRALLALGLRGGLRLDPRAVALGGLLTLLGRKLVLELLALLLVAGAVLGELGLLLSLACLGGALPRLDLGVGGGLLQPALAGQLVVVGQGSRGLLRLAGEAADETTRGSLGGVAHVATPGSVFPR